MAEARYTALITRDADGRLAAGSFFEGDPDSYTWGAEMAAYAAFLTSQMTRLTELDQSIGEELATYLRSIDPIAEGQPGVDAFASSVSGNQVNADAISFLKAVADSEGVATFASGLDDEEQAAIIPLAVIGMIDHLLKREATDETKRRVILWIPLLIGRVWTAAGGIQAEDANELAQVVTEQAFSMDDRVSAGVQSATQQTNDDDTAAAGWYPDPFGRFNHRYWDGTWTASVSSNGRTYMDEPE